MIPETYTHTCQQRQCKQFGGLVAWGGGGGWLVTVVSCVVCLCVCCVFLGCAGCRVFKRAVSNSPVHLRRNLHSGFELRGTRSYSVLKSTSLVRTKSERPVSELQSTYLFLVEHPNHPNEFLLSDYKQPRNCVLVHSMWWCWISKMRIGTPTD
jgi:hypothetical protein